MQLREVPVTPVPEGSDELDDEAEWIYKQAFCKPTITTQVKLYYFSCLIDHCIDFRVSIVFTKKHSMIIFLINIYAGK